MKLTLKPCYRVRLPRFCSILFLAALTTLTSCDSPTDDIPVQKVDDQSQLSDTELQQQQNEQSANKADGVKEFYFGFDLRGSPQEDAAQYVPFLDYLETATGYHFKLHFTPKNSTTADELGMNTTQFASMGATSYLKASSQYEVASLVRGINHQGKAEYQSVFVARPDSPIDSIKDIRGRKLAFGSEDSTQGHLIPRIMLADNNISLEDLKAYGYTGSHQKCAESVVSGKYDVCGMQDQLAKTLAGQGILKIFHSSNFYPSSGIAANKSVPAEIINSVKQALIDFKPLGIHREGLYHWERTEMPGGFVAASEIDYAELLKWSIHFGFLVEESTQGQ